MATCQPLPVSLRRVHRLVTTPNTRSFTSTCRTQSRRLIERQLGKQQTLQSRMAAMKRNELPDDLGLLPEMLIKPAQKDLPSFFSRQWLRRIRIENKAYWQRLLDFGRLIYSKKWDCPRNPKTNKRIREPFYMQERYAVARRLHQELYSAIARRDEKTIQEIACTGLKRQMQVRIANKRAARAPTEEMSISYDGLTFEKLPWFLQNLIPARFRSTRIVVDRQMPVPLGERITIRQVVVRLKSTQALRKEDSSVQSTVQAEEMVVIQQFNLNGERQPWKIWGTVEASSPEAIDKLLNKGGSSTNLTLTERFKDLIARGSSSGAGSV